MMQNVIRKVCAHHSISEGFAKHTLTKLSSKKFSWIECRIFNRISVKLNRQSCDRTDSTEAKVSSAFTSL